MKPSAAFGVFLVVVLLVLAALAVVGVQKSVPFDTSKGLIGYWTFNEGTGTSAYDYSGSGLTETFVGAPAWTVGKFGGALNFTSSSSEYLTAAKPLNLNSSFSVSGWVKIYGTVGSAYAVIAEGPAAASGDFAVYTQSSTGDLTLLVGSGSGTYTVHTPNSYLTNTWTFFGLEWNGTYLNAYSAGSFTTGTAFSGPPAISTYDLWIGRVGAGNYMSGAVDDLQIHNYSLSLSQFTSLASQVPGAAP